MNSPLRVLHVLAGMNLGGAETFIMNVYRNIDRTKVQFDFILFRKEECEFNSEIRELGGKIYWIPRYNGKNHFKFKKAWNNFFKTHPTYKVIHGHVRSTASIYLKIAKKYGLTTIAHSHSSSSRGKLIDRFIKKLFQFQIRIIANYFFSCSNEAGKWLFGKKVVNKENYKLIKNAIEADKFIYNNISRDNTRNALKIQHNFVIGHIGSFTYPKNHDFLINVFKEVHNRQGNAILLLIGDGELRSSIEEKIKDYNLTGNVILTGVRSDIPDLLQAMDVFVFPSLFEGLGIVAIEAQAAGLPCIVSDVLPQEAFVTNLIQKVSLKESLSKWAHYILKRENYKRANTHEQIVSKGYDINDTVKWLENFYITSSLQKKIIK